MLTRGDVNSRLRFFRYGLVVVVVVTFIVTLLFGYVYVRPLGGTITAFLSQAILFSIGVAIIGVIIYFIYHYLLTKRLPIGGGGSEG